MPFPSPSAAVRSPARFTAPRRTAAALLAACGLGGPILGAPAPAAAQATAMDSARAALATAYLRVDRLDATAPPGLDRVAVNAAFDGSTLAFFAGAFGKAIATMDSLSLVLAGGDAARVAAVRDSVEAIVRARFAAAAAGAGSGRRPLRVHVPAALQATGAPAPLLVALHGAGGDENLFLDGYGAGRVTRLADSLGLVVASPLANGFTPAAFDSLLARVAAVRAIDTTRVYVIGHSMGAGFAAGLANARGAAIRAVACLAGGAPVTAAGAPPVLFIGAGHDPIIPAARVEAAAAASGERATYRVLADEGHTLMVGRALPQALAWLVSHAERE